MKPGGIEGWWTGELADTGGPSPRRHDDGVWRVPEADRQGALGRADRGIWQAPEPLHPRLFLKAFDYALNDQRLAFDIAYCSRIVMRYRAAVAMARVQ